MSRKILLLLPVLFLCFLGTASAQLCREPIEMTMGPDEWKKVGDVSVSTYKRYDEHIEVSYYSNVFKQKTDTSCHELDLRFDFSVKGKKIIAPKTVDLIFFSLSNALKYDAYGSHSLKIVADEKTVFTDIPYNSTRMHEKNKSYGEKLTSSIDFAAFEKIAQAKAVTISLGTTKIELTAKQLEGVKQMYALIEK
jgi:hypothetical protein